MALYADTLRDGFVTDDNRQLTGNPFVTSWHNIPELFANDVWGFTHHGASNYYRPLQILFYMGEYYAFGFHPWAFHLVNVLLNVVVVFAAYFLVRALAERKLALWAALLFAFHPIHTEVVAWIAALPELLCALSLLTGMLLYHRARNGIRPAMSYGMATAVFFAGTFCKETTLVFPGLLLAYEFLYRREPVQNILRRWRRFAPYVCAIAIYVAIRLKVLGTFAPTFAPFTWRQKFFTVPVLLGQYIFKCIWPVNMNYFYEFHPRNSLGWEFVASVVVIGGLVAAIFLLRQPQPLLAFAIAWFFMVIAPVLSISRIGENVFTERYLYIPSLGLCIAAAWAWMDVKRSISQPRVMRVAHAALATVLIFWTVLIARRLPEWRTDTTLLAKTAEQSPNSATVQWNLGAEYYQSGQLDLAIAPLERSVSIDPKAIWGHLYLAIILPTLGETQEAREQLAQAESLRSPAGAPWSLFGEAYANLKQWDRAIECDRKEIETEPRNPILYTVMGEAMQSNGQTEESMAAFRQALQLDPGFLDAGTNLAITLAEQGNSNEAVRVLTGTLEANPKGIHADAGWFNLGNIYANNREWTSAADAYQRALDLNPDSEAARQRLESVEAQAAASR